MITTHWIIKNYSWGAIPVCDWPQPLTAASAWRLSTVQALSGWWSIAMWVNGCLSKTVQFRFRLIELVIYREH